MSDTQGVAGNQLRTFVERIERLEEEKKAIADDISGGFSRFYQGIALKICRLIKTIFGDPCIANEHIGKPLLSTFRTPTHSDRYFRILFLPKSRTVSRCQIRECRQKPGHPSGGRALWRGRVERKERIERIAV